MKGLHKALLIGMMLGCCTIWCRGNTNKIWWSHEC